VRDKSSCEPLVMILLNHLNIQRIPIGCSVKVFLNSLQKKLKTAAGCFFKTWTVLETKI
jgi:hypothetical protein